MRTRVPEQRKNRGMKLQIPPSWIEPLRLYELHLRAAGLSEGTIERRIGDVEQIARDVGPDGPDTITGDLLVEWVGGKVWAIETRRSRRASARSFWAWAVVTGFASENAALSLPHVPAAKPKPRPVPDRIYRPAVCSARPRVRLMLRLGAELGLRRAEIARIHVGNDLVLDDDDEGYELIVHGKGNKTARVPVPADLAAQIRAGAPGHSPGLGYPRGGWLFPGQIDGHLSPRHVGDLCAAELREQQEAGEQDWTTHKLRHRFGTRALRRTKNIRAVQEALRHASVATTEIYCAVEKKEVREAVNAAA